MGGRALLLISLLAVVAGCGDPDPDELVFLYGTVQQPDGVPVPDVQVALERSTDCGSALPYGFSDQQRPTWNGYGSQQTTSQGEFIFPLRISEVNGRFTSALGGTNCFRASTGRQEDGATAAISVVHDLQDMQLPPLFVWTGSVEASVEAAGVRVHSAQPPPVLPDLEPITVNPDRTPGPRQTARWELSTDAGLAFRATGDDADLLVLPELVEDFGTAQAQLVVAGNGDHSPPASVALPLPSFGFDARLRSASVAVALTTPPRLPISRGAACEAGDAGVEALCPFTDGQLVEAPVTPADADAFFYNSVTVHLSAPRLVRRVVVHGLRPDAERLSLQIEGSLDQGSSWFPVAQRPAPASEGPLEALSSDGLDFDLPVDPPVEAEWIRLSAWNQPVIYSGDPSPPSAPAPWPIFQLAELSVFE